MCNNNFSGPRNYRLAADSSGAFFSGSDGVARFPDRVLIRSAALQGELEKAAGLKLPVCTRHIDQIQLLRRNAFTTSEIMAVIRQYSAAEDAGDAALEKLASLFMPRDNLGELSFDMDLDLAQSLSENVLKSRCGLSEEGKQHAENNLLEITAFRSEIPALIEGLEAKISGPGNHGRVMLAIAVLRLETGDAESAVRWYRESIRKMAREFKVLYPEPHFDGHPRLLRTALAGLCRAHGHLLQYEDAERASFLFSRANCSNHDLANPPDKFVEIAEML